MRENGISGERKSFLGLGSSTWFAKKNAPSQIPVWDGEYLKSDYGIKVISRILITK